MKSHSCAYGVVLVLVLGVPSFVTTMLIATSFPVGMLRFGIIASALGCASAAFVLGRLSTTEPAP